DRVASAEHETGTSPPAAADARRLLAPAGRDHPWPARGQSRYASRSPAAPTAIRLRRRHGGFGLDRGLRRGPPFLGEATASERFWRLLPLPPLVIWLSTIGCQCLTHWISLGANGMQLGETIRCFATLVLTGAPLSFAMLVMLRYAGILRPIATALTG